LERGFVAEWGYTKRSNADEVARKSLELVEKAG
jgi:hypothetical protein